MKFLSHRTGWRRVFAIEFEVEPDRTRPANEWWGSLWLWVEGRCVGETHEIEMVSVGLGALIHAAKATRARARASPLFASLPAEQALDQVMRAIYGEADEPDNI